MSAVTKFLFETTFDIIPGPVVEEKPVADEPEDAAVEEEPEEFIPTFSEEEMKEAREQGFSNGKEEALRDALELVENKLFESLQRIDQNMTEIFSIQATTNEELPRASASIAVAMARKIVPELASRNAIDEIVKSGRNSHRQNFNRTPCDDYRKFRNFRAIKRAPRRHPQGP